jgi:parallel beta-helix repeat protein
MHRFLKIDRLQWFSLRSLAMLGTLALALNLIACSEDDSTQPPGFSTADVLVDDDRVQCPAAVYSDLQAAVDIALPGQTIAVCAGSYTGTITVPSGKTGLTLLGAGGTPATRNSDPAKEAILLGSPDGQPGFAIQADGTTIIGFTILRTSDTGIEVKVGDGSTTINGTTIASNVIDTTGDPETLGPDCAGGRGVNIEVADDVLIEDNLVRLSCGAGIRLMAAVNTIVQHNTITGSRKRPGIAVRNGSNHNKIISNVSRGNREGGISLQGSTDNVVQDNSMSDNGLSGIPLRDIPGPGSNTDADDTTNLPLENPPLNTWQGNTCGTANRHGLCET